MTITVSILVDMSFLNDNRDNPQDRGVAAPGGSVSFRPQLYTVATGSLATANYGLNAATVENYDAVTERSSANSRCQSSGSYSRAGKLVVFEVNLCLDAEAASPITTATDEVRLGAQAPAVSQPAGYGKGLPAPATEQLLELEVRLDVAGVNTTPLGAADSLLAARLLKDGSIALVSRNVAAAGAPEAAITDAALTAAGLFGAGAGDLAKYHVSGSYIAQ